MKITDPFSLQRQVSFDCSSSINDGIYLLSKSVAKPTFQPKFDESLIGKISIDKIEIWLFRPLNRNGLFPTFYGKFYENNAGKSILIGEFRMNDKTRMTYILGFFATIVFWVCIAIRDHSFMTFLFGFIGTIIFTSVALFFCKSISKKDAETIEQQIRNILTSSTSNQGARPDR